MQGGNKYHQENKVSPQHVFKIKEAQTWAVPVDEQAIKSNSLSFEIDKCPLCTSTKSQCWVFVVIYLFIFLAKLRWEDYSVKRLKKKLLYSDKDA